MCILMTGGRNVIVVFISMQLKVTMAGDSAAEGGTLGTCLLSILYSLSWPGPHIRAKQGAHVSQPLKASG